jgi:hypothetical protein
MTDENEVPHGRQSVLVGTYAGEPWIAYPSRRPSGQVVWALEMSNRRFETDITADDADLIAGRPSLTPKTAARINEWLRENELKWRPVS